MLVVTYVYRTSSTSKYSTKKVFPDLESAAKYIQNDWYDIFCETNNYPAKWNAADLSAPFPSRDTFSLQGIINIRNRNGNSVVLFGPHSLHSGLVENELRLEEAN
jgi:hypothetical protein